MNNSVGKNLPVLGSGPLFVVTIFALTALATAVCWLGWLDAGRVAQTWLWVIFVVVGCTLVVTAVGVWCAAVFGSRMVVRVREGQLMTTGIYAWVRHPVYSAFLLLNTGLILLLGNWFFLVLPLGYWLFLTVLMRATEESWLAEKFGQDYLQYAAGVNRCLPWPPAWPRLRLR